MKRTIAYLTFCTFFALTGLISSCQTSMEKEVVTTKITNQTILTGAQQTELYLPLLKDKKIAIVANQTSKIGNAHVVDSLQSLGIEVQCVFAPEHGFRGNAEAGAFINNGVDEKSGLRAYSLYGKTKKPTAEMMSGLDLVVFDIQDVGARFYTYISTMHYVMEACADHGVDFMVLDRPNPNGFYVDGPVLDPEYKSFVGMHPIPIVHGMTIGELCNMIVGEGWLESDKTLKPVVIPCSGYNHKSRYALPIPPSPNLPNMNSIYLYPSLCLFEGTDVSIGRGTPSPFQVVGHPDFGLGSLQFTPVSMPGYSLHPKHENESCNGQSLHGLGEEIGKNGTQLELFILIGYYQELKDKTNFFNSNLFFDKLAGTDQLRKDIMAGKTEDDIRNSWKPAIEDFKNARRKYLIYDDFE